MTHPMRERLIAKTVAELGDLPTTMPPPNDRMALDSTRPLRVIAEGLVDALLAELRVPDEAMVTAGIQADPWTGEPVAREFTAMIDAVKEGK